MDRARNAVANLVATGSRGELGGFILGAAEPDRLILGPVVAVNDAVALGLIAQLSQHWNRCMRIDVRSSRQALIRSLLAAGFSLERICPVMTYQARHLGFSDRYKALVSQAFG